MKEGAELVARSPDVGSVDPCDTPDAMEVLPKPSRLPKVHRFAASVTCGKDEHEEGAFPVYAEDQATAKRLALAYVLEGLKLRDFELRLFGA